MDIELKEITIRELVKNYEDNNEGGVVGYDGKLDIRPPFQREFVYQKEQRDAVIDTVAQKFPLNVMYWAVRETGDFEIIDGQQRTISICQFVKGDFSVGGIFDVEEARYFYNLQNDEKERILNYKLMIYQCTGEDSEKLKWFETINIAGAQLTKQELKNAVYSGSWVTDAKRYFSKNNCAAYGLGSKYLSGKAIRQEYLETAIKWINKGAIEAYMAKHQHDEKAEPLWKYFQEVIKWVKSVFPNYRGKEMKGIAWGEIYNAHAKEKFDAASLEKEIAELMEDEDVTNKKGIYQFVLTGEEKHLNIRAFSDKEKREAYERQNGICAKCGEKFALDKMQADHMTPWSKGGKTNAENCQMLCSPCNRQKSDK